MAPAGVVLWLLLTAVSHAGSGAVHAFLDRDHAQLGDTVTLNVQIDGAADVDAPDVSALGQDFDVLGTSRNTSISIDNGKRTERTLWAVSLQPRHTGTLTIPPLQVGGQRTAALTLAVTAAPATAQGGPGDPVFIETSLDDLTPYVGQQVDLTVRLFYAPNLTDGNIEQPRADGVQVRALGRDARYQTERGGRRYHVVEQHYALIPQRAGKLDIAPLVFRGRAMGADDFSSFFGGGQAVQARSAALAMQVRSRPQAARGSGPWLPARQLVLGLDGLPPDGRVQVGEPLTLTLSEQATGLPFEALPEPDLPPLDGVQVYPDKPQDSTRNDGTWLHGTRSRKFAVIPQRAGTLTIPEITLHWWNVGDDRPETARIPAHTLTVTAAAGMDAGAPPAPAASIATTALPARMPAVAPDGPVSTPWRAMAMAGLGLWLATMVAIGVWFWRRRRRVDTPPPPAQPGADSGRRLRNAFLHAVRAGDVRAQAAALLAWARSERPSLHSLGDLAAALDAPAQSDAVAALQRARYAAAGVPPDRDRLAAAFAGGLRWRRSMPPAESPLPPLYPR
jgi:hypothetical protein